MHNRLAFYKIAILFIGLFTGLPSIHGHGLTAGKIKPDTIACGCPQIKYVNPGFRFYNSLGRVIKYDELMEVMPWAIDGEKSTFDYLFIKHDNISRGREEVQGQISVISNRKPIKLSHPDKTFTINFTPCRDENYIYELPLTFDYKHLIKRELRDFEYKKFDFTALAYVHLFLEISGKRPDQIIRSALKDLAWRDDDFKGMNRVINEINLQFQTGIPLVNDKTYRDSITISGILDSLVSKKLRQEAVITTGFVLTKPGIHRINYDEEYRLFILFRRDQYPTQGLANYEKEVLLPRYYLSLDVPRVIVEISPAILQQDIKIKNKELTAASIWADTKTDRTYYSDKGMQIGFTGVSMPPTMIAGTTIGIDFTQAQLIDKQPFYAESFDYSWYPQFMTGIVPGKKSADKQAAPLAKYDSLLTRFSGLVVKDAILTVAAGKDTLKVAASNVIINNLLMAGQIVLKLTPSNLNLVITSGRNNDPKVMPTTKLVATLKKSGLKIITTKVVNGQFVIYFKKLAF